MTVEEAMEAMDTRGEFELLMRECVDAYDEFDNFDPRDEGDYPELQRLSEEVDRTRRAVAKFAIDHPEALLE